MCENLHQILLFESPWTYYRMLFSMPSSLYIFRVFTYMFIIIQTLSFFFRKKIILIIFYFVNFKIIYNDFLFKNIFLADNNCHQIVGDNFFFFKSFLLFWRICSFLIPFSICKKERKKSIFSNIRHLNSTSLFNLKKFKFKLKYFLKFPLLFPDFSMF